MGGADGVHVSGEMEVDILHWHDLRKTAPCRTPFQAETGPEAGLAQADRRIPAQPVERVSQANRHRGLALARRRRTHRGDQDQFAIGPLAQRVDVL